MLKEIEDFGGEIKGVFYCTHREEDNCSCRKPKTGLIKRAVGERKVNLRDTFFIGDSLKDIETGKNAGCKTILVLSGETRKKDISSLQVKPDFITQNLLEAVKLILNESNSCL
jgi:histidinol phosphatase-like enzyme